MGDIYADVIIDISHEALDKIFQYRVPLSLYGDIEVGSRVYVPFGRGNRKTEGYVIGIGTETEYDKEKIKDILSLVKDSMTVNTQLIAMAAYLKKQYGASMIQALKTVMPVKDKMKPKLDVTIYPGVSREQGEELLSEWERKHFTAKVRFMQALLKEDRLTKEKAVSYLKFPLKEIKKLEQEGIVVIKSAVHYRNPFPDFTKKEDHKALNAEQKEASRLFSKDYLAGIRKTYLLYGVTGSGKTEVYMALMDTVLSLKKQVIVLIPEISLTFQTVRRFYERFGDRIAVLNSRMSKGERSDTCARIEAGEVDVVIGPRSALFAALPDVGLIIIDEEHDGAYKSDSVPKYHAREAAIHRAQLAGASVVLGSATPSVESFGNARQGRYELLTLTKRAGAAILPEVETVDLREEFAKGNRSMFSEELQELIRDRLEKKEQIMLFLNRRGFAGFVSCRSCGTVMKCPHCDVSLTYHRNGKLSCHYCGYQIPYTRTCPKCNSPHVAAFGLGTEKVEAALYQEFPEARVIRMDMDTTRKKNAHARLLASFSKGEADILVGTQMIVKGHDYANVTLVGILAADLSLFGQDFRSGERTFQLLCQAAGRAGRGEKRGKVIIQTYSPDHYAIEAARHQSYEEFFTQEYAYRNAMGYPPCAHMMVILVQSVDEREAILGMMRIEKMIKQNQEGKEEPVKILAPGQAALSKLKDVYRQVIYMKHEQVEALTEVKNRLEPILEKHPLFMGIQVQFDLDPMNFY